MRVTRHEPYTDPGLELERFDYSPITGRWAVVRLVTRLREDIGLPPAPTLVINGTELCATHARACVIERRLSDSTGSISTLWRGAFAVPLELVSDADAGFTLCHGDELLMALPAPTLRCITHRSLDLRAPAPPRPAGQGASAARRRITAVATAAVLTSTSPAVALASAATQKTTSTATSPAAVGLATTASAAASAAAPPTAAPPTAAPSTATPSTATPPSATATTPTTSAPATATTTSTATPAPTTTVATGARTTTAAQRTAAAQRSAAVHRTAAAARSAAAARTATAEGTAAAHDAGGERRSAAARRIAILNAGVRQTADREHTAIGAERTQRRFATRTAATSRAHTIAASSSTEVHLLSTTPGYAGPTSWTGVVPAQSSLTGAVRNLSGLLSDGDRPPSFLIPIYMEAGRRYHVPWEVLAAINAIESDYGRDLNTSSAGAIGWMQFEPSTWKRYGVAADGVSEANPYDPRDAIFAAAHYLQAAGGSTDIREAVFAYNHAGWYVDEVLQRAEAIAEHVQYQRASVSRRGTVSVDFDTDLKTHPRVRYSSGTLSHYDRLIAAANMVSAADFRYLWGGGHQEPSRFGPFDCSGSVSYVMQQAGYKVDTTVAADIGAWKLPSGPGRVTIFYDATHTFMRIDGRFFGTSGFARPGDGAGWFDVDRLPTGYLANFHEVHVPDLGINSFSADAALPLGRAPLTPRARQAARERSAVSAFDEARVGALASQALSHRRMVQDLAARGLHLLRRAPDR
jgi:soluble lytic murein transglycosylase-like protein